MRLDAAHTCKAGWIGDGFVVLVGQFVGEEFGEEMADAALEPDVEEVGQLGVLHVVVVRWVYGNVIDAIRGNFKIICSSPVEY